MTDPARHLRLHGEPGLVNAQADRIGVSREELPHVLVGAWTEGREMAGERLDRTLQAWVDEHGERVG